MQLAFVLRWMNTSNTHTFRLATVLFSRCCMFAALSDFFVLTLSRVLLQSFLERFVNRTVCWVLLFLSLAVSLLEGLRVAVRLPGGVCRSHYQHVQHPGRHGALHLPETSPRRSEAQEGERGDDRETGLLWPSGCRWLAGVTRIRTLTRNLLVALSLFLLFVSTGYEDVQ